jgi:hypothetical protein
MADRNKFEEMLERLINEDKSGAEELFHEIVVEKSRDIYEGLLENDLEEVTDEEVDETTDEEVDEATDEEVDETTDEEVDEGFDLDEFEVEADPMDMGGDPADDMMSDIEDAGDEEEGEEGEEGDVEDRVEDLEDALDDLKAEFEKMMAGDEGGDDEAEDDMEAGDEDDDSEEESFNFGEAEEDTEEAVEEATDEDEVEESTEPKTAGEEMREYVEKVSAKMGDNGANSKSTVAGTNDMGGDAGNLVQGGEETGRTADSAKDETAGNVNVPGGKASKSMKAQPKGHGAEKKGAGESADNKKSTVGK